MSSFTRSPYILGLIEPGMLLYMAVSTYLSVLLKQIKQIKLHPLSISLPAIRSQAFGIFWENISAPPDPAQPLAGSATLVPPLLEQATGTVLDVGPGSGTLIHNFEPALPRIARIYGAEPATELHKALQRNTNKTAVGAKYTILPANATHESIAQALTSQRVLEHPSEAKNIFDTIVCVRVLCSVPNQRATINDLHGLLKPGGRLLIVEHVRNPWRTPKGSVIARAMQTLYMLLGWKYFIGDCELTRDTENMLRTQKGWQSIDIERHFGSAVFSYISGVMIKDGSES